MENLSHSLVYFSKKVESENEVTGPFIGLVIVKQMDVPSIISTYTAYNFSNTLQFTFDYR